MPADPPAAPGRAREARANDTALFRAAREVFAERGYDAPMSLIAERAGIGVGGIYRRYASKDDLIRELRRSSLEDIVQTAGASAADGGDDGTVAHFLRSHLEQSTGHLPTLLNRSTPMTPEIERLSDELHEALKALVELDAARGVIPYEFGPGDIMAAIVHLRPSASDDPDEDRALNLRHLEYYLRGLRASLAEPVRVGASMTWDDWMRHNSMR
ncbi:TetR/AcrR family transcriptional regulator [Microbacterium sp. H1-D42]|uniref:TetR/AcrR family transcriptional regulator n=1 Tax=Microbacterium sp. H1-D42 TaxID=2925844 RepID=UPI001F53A3DB|nr:TetR/AcrR family transcriptional regulator [Microbacterium sp. H1-D42]UNK72425.1 TetR/AcrR family transcriptional regulator [Microbacterium sp. H1-D42]